MQKKLRIFCILIFSFLILASFGFHAEAADVSKGAKASKSTNYKYTVKGKKVTIKKYIGKSKKVVVPKKIEGYPVVTIGSRAFAKCKSITSVKLPNSLKKIGLMAFENCTNLKSVVIPKNVKLIESSAFGKCTKLTNVTIKGKNTKFTEYSFTGCKNLKKVQTHKDYKAIVFIGNSMTYYPVIPTFFEKLAAAKGVHYQVFQYTRPDYSVAMHKRDFDRDQVSVPFLVADTVVFQDMDTFDVTVPIVNEMRRKFPKMKKVYFLETEYMPYVEADLAPYNIKKIPFFNFYEKILDSGRLTWEQLHEPNDFHPNYLSGYFSACEACKVILGFKETDFICQGFGEYEIYDQLPGNSKSEKLSFVRSVLK